MKMKQIFESLSEQLDACFEYHIKEIFIKESTAKQTKLSEESMIAMLQNLSTKYKYFFLSNACVYFKIVTEAKENKNFTNEFVIAFSALWNTSKYKKLDLGLIYAERSKESDDSIIEQEAMANNCITLIEDRLYGDISAKEYARLTDEVLSTFTISALAKLKES